MFLTERKLERRVQEEKIRKKSSRIKEISL